MPPDILPPDMPPGIPPDALPVEPLLPPPAVEAPAALVEPLPGRTQKGHVIPNLTALWGPM